MLTRIIGAVLLAITLAGCNMMSGLGRDIQRGGQNLTNEARETQHEMHQQR